MANNRVSLLVMLLVIALSPLVCSATLYNVGDSGDWRLGIDYNQWACSKSFHVGDTIVFKFNPQIYNVVQVSKQDYESCNASSPINIYITGHDYITLQSAVDSYFLSGFPGQCHGGLKLKVHISVESSSPTPPTTMTPPSPPTTIPGLSPNPPFICNQPYCPPTSNMPGNDMPFYASAPSLLAARSSLLALCFLPLYWLLFASC
ncbi:hypothetical protein Tsubulata_038787 [Turnera subulata]|uniref:Phytocyanin domain-containing protein n=1 Tax=Turnera subulata TaxID=218843 RepID=A0A9Q0F315_9ROSI|nr:hypothetical protein Tsubulata_038787 [Turnera subulata]